MGRSRKSKKNATKPTACVPVGAPWQTLPQMESNSTYQQLMASQCGDPSIQGSIDEAQNKDDGPHVSAVNFEAFNETVGSFRMPGHSSGSAINNEEVQGRNERFCNQTTSEENNDGETPGITCSVDRYCPACAEKYVSNKCKPEGNAESNAAKKSPIKADEARKMIDEIGLQKLNGFKCVNMRFSPDMNFIVEDPDVYLNIKDGTYIILGQLRIDTIRRPNSVEGEDFESDEIIRCEEVAASLDQLPVDDLHQCIQITDLGDDSARKQYGNFLSEDAELNNFQYVEETGFFIRRTGNSGIPCLEDIDDFGPPTWNVAQEVFDFECSDAISETYGNEDSGNCSSMSPGETYTWTLTHKPPEINIQETEETGLNEGDISLIMQMTSGTRWDAVRALRRWGKENIATGMMEIRVLKGVTRMPKDSSAYNLSHSLTTRAMLHSEIGIVVDSIDLVLETCAMIDLVVSRSNAVFALRKSNYDPMEAVLYLMSQ